MNDTDRDTDTSSDTDYGTVTDNYRGKSPNMGRFFFKTAVTLRKML